MTARAPPADSAPATSAENVANDGAVKHGRGTPRTINSDGGAVTGIPASPKDSEHGQKHKTAPEQATKDAAAKRVLATPARTGPAPRFSSAPAARCYVAVAPRARTRRRPPLPAAEREPFPAPGLRCQGSAGRWLVGICKARTETYDQDELPTRPGPTITTPKRP